MGSGTIQEGLPTKPEPVTIDIENEASKFYYQETRFTSSGHVLAIDLHLDGSHHIHPELPLAKQQSLSQELPAVRPNAIRLVLVDSLVYQKPSDLLYNKRLSERSKGEYVPVEGVVREKEDTLGFARLGSKTLYDDGRTTEKVTFNHVKARAFDVFDLENFWRPAKHRTVCPFYAQWNVHRKHLDGPQFVSPEKVLEANLGQFFFCDRISFHWEYLSIVESRLGSDDRIEGKPLLFLRPSERLTKSFSIYNVSTVACWQLVSRPHTFRSIWSICRGVGSYEQPAGATPVTTQDALPMDLNLGRCSGAHDGRVRQLHAADDIH